jgi:hypothetical protein
MDTNDIETAANRMLCDGATASSFNQMAAKVNEAATRATGEQATRLNALHGRLKNAVAYQQVGSD